jgi:hypothetical protein
MVQATQTLRYARVINHGRPTAKIVLNKMRLRERTSRELLAMAPQLGVEVASSVLRDVQLYRDAAQQGTVVTRMRGSVGAAPDEMSQLCCEVREVARSARTPGADPDVKEAPHG